MQRLRSQGMMARGAAVLVFLTCGAALAGLAAAQTTLQDLCGACTVEVFAKGGKFLEGPAFDTEGNLWVVSIQSGGSVADHSGRQPDAPRCGDKGKVVALEHRHAAAPGWAALSRLHEQGNLGGYLVMATVREQYADDTPTTHCGVAGLPAVSGHAVRPRHRPGHL